MVTEYVMLNSDSTKWVAGKWAVIAATLTGANAGFTWIKRISYGVATEQDLTDYIDSYNNGDGLPDKSKLDGILSEYKVVAISDISAHKRNSLHVENMPPSVYPVG